MEMKTGGGLVQDVESTSRAALIELAGQLDPLGLPAGKGCGRLTQVDITQANLAQSLQPGADIRTSRSAVRAFSISSTSLIERPL